MTLHISSVFTYDEDAGNYIQAVEAADGQVLEGATRMAINNFVIGCKQDGIWDAIKASCILAGARTLSGALVPLAGTAPTNYNFVAGDYNRKTGLVGDGSTKYLDSNRLANSAGANNYHMSIYASSYISGSYIGGSSTPYANRINGTSARITQSAGAGGGTPLTTTLFIGGSRNDSAFFTLRSNGTSTSVAEASVDPGNVSVRVFAQNFGSGVIDFANTRLPFYSIGESLNLALLDARVTDLITAFGAAIP